jgi:predicted CopG family antitoxin
LNAKIARKEANKSRRGKSFSQVVPSVWERKKKTKEQMLQQAGGDRLSDEIE